MEQTNFKQSVKRSVFIQGKLVTFKEAARIPLCPPPKKLGCVIRTFSDSARLRLLKRIARIDWSKLPTGVFVTLTYPDDRVKVEPKVATMQRNHFIRYAEKYLCRNLPILWCKEYIDRKSGRWKGMFAHHWHLSIFGVDFIPWQMITDWWRRSIKAVGPLNTHIEVMDSGEHAAFYLCKYLAKKDRSSNVHYHLNLTKPGRHWGFRRHGLFPYHPADFINALTDEQWQAIMEQVLAIKASGSPLAPGSFSLLGPRAEEAAKVVYEIMS